MRVLTVIFILLTSLSVYSQSNKGSKYIHIQMYSNDEFKIQDTINHNLVLLNSKNNNAFEEVETGMFKINKSCKLRNLRILVNKQIIELNLRKYRKNKFFNIKIYIPTNNNGNQSVIKFKRGDAISIINNCELDECNVILVEFPQIIIINETVITTINRKFYKYIFK